MIKKLENIWTIENNMRLCPPILFNIFLRNLFLITKDKCVTSYADDNAPYFTNVPAAAKTTFKMVSVNIFQ